MKLTNGSRQHIAGEVRAAMARKNIKQGELAKTLGMSRVALSERLRGNRAFNTDELFTISTVLDIAFAELWPAA